MTLVQAVPLEPGRIGAETGRAWTSPMTRSRQKDSPGDPSTMPDSPRLEGGWPRTGRSWRHSTGPERTGVDPSAIRPVPFHRPSSWGRGCRMRRRTFGWLPEVSRDSLGLEWVGPGASRRSQPLRTHRSR
jgi:hypothetical protein